RRDRWIGISERASESGHAPGVESPDLGPLEPRREAREKSAVHAADDTIRRVRTLPIVSALVLSACTTAVPIPRQPFSDITVPKEWVAYSRESVIIQTPKATAAKLIVFAEPKADAP